MPPVLFIVGPTAVGKTALTLTLARTRPLEVVSMDSRQVYRGMDIGTAKPSPAQMAQVPHHVIDVVDPDGRFDAGRYACLAGRALDEIVAGERVPAVVGGTGLYMRALLDGFFRGPGRDDALRRELGLAAREKGTVFLHTRLAAVDPVSARRLHPNDVTRIVRALEVYEITGRSMTELWRESPGRPYACQPLVVGLTMPLRELDRRIQERTRQMLDAGFMREVETLLQTGYGPELPSMSAVGYREVVACIHGTLSPDVLEERIARSTRRYARRQLRWFRADPRVQWLDGREPDGLVEHVTRLWSAHEAGDAGSGMAQ
jgi:tRNA dimethylallyltransferase